MRKLPASRDELAKWCARRGNGGLGQPPVQGAARRVPGARDAGSPGTLRAGLRSGAEPGAGGRAGGPLTSPVSFSPFQDLTFLTKQEILL